MNLLFELSLTRNENARVDVTWASQIRSRLNYNRNSPFQDDPSHEITQEIQSIQKTHLFQSLGVSLIFLPQTHYQ